MSRLVCVSTSKIIDLRSCRHNSQPVGVLLADHEALLLPFARPQLQARGRLVRVGRSERCWVRDLFVVEQNLKRAKSTPSRHHAENPLVIL